jgi:hypothetical protein
MLALHCGEDKDIRDSEQEATPVMLEQEEA